MGTGGDTGAATTMKAGELMDASGGFYSYPGSLTTPTCNAVVTWVVLASVKSIKGVCACVCGVCVCVQCAMLVSPRVKVNKTEGTMTKFRDIMSGTEKVSKHGNFRPLQTIGDRTIYM